MGPTVPPSLTQYLRIPPLITRLLNTVLKMDRCFEIVLWYFKGKHTEIASLQTQKHSLAVVHAEKIHHKDRNKYFHIFLEMPVDTRINDTTNDQSLQFYEAMCILYH